MALPISRHLTRSVVISSCSCCGTERTYSHTGVDTVDKIYKTSLQPLQFDDHRTVFRHKSNWELLRGLLVLRACGSNFLVDNSLKLLREGQKMFGDQIMGWILHPTVYSQFVAGQEGSDLAVTTESLRRLGIKLMVAPTLEEDVGESTSNQEKYDNNLIEMFRLADLTHRHGGKQPCLQTKITAMISADTLRNLTNAFANEKIEMCIKVVEHIASAMVTGSEIQDIPHINKKDQKNMVLAVRRLKQLGEVATAKQLHLLVDAEYSYVNPGCSLLTLAMMAAFNQHRPVIANTYQCYFKRALQTFTHELEITKRLGACFPVKLVRGAYLEKERKMDPKSVCESYSETGENYHRVLEQVLTHVLKDGPERNLAIIATHNERTVHHATSRLQQLGLDPKAGHIVFAQIYGMAEQISLPLARAGYIVYKSVPMGALNQVLPYLARRAAENRSVLHGARKERQLLEQELAWRIKSSLHW